MKTVNDIYEFIDTFAPFKNAFRFDNCGILVGNKDAKVSKVLLALDITDKTAKEAKECGAELIISHHPVIFNPLKNINSSTPSFYLAQNGISAICAHTNLDISENFGVNTCLAQKLELKNLVSMEKDDNDVPQWFLGEIENSQSAEDFAAYVKEKLNCTYVKYTGGSSMIKKVGICSGAASQYFESAADFVDAFVTAEVKHHEFIKAESLDFTLIDAGHFETENIVIEPLAKKLSVRFPDIEFIISETAASARYI